MSAGSKAEAERQFLDTHGTTLFNVTATHVLQAVDADFRRKAENQLRASHNASLFGGKPVSLLSYAYPAKMLRESRTPVELLEKLCANTPKPKTRDQRYLFNHFLITGALELARQREAEEGEQHAQND